MKQIYSKHFACTAEKKPRLKQVGVLEGMHIVKNKHLLKKDLPSLYKHQYTVSV